MGIRGVQVIEWLQQKQKQKQKMRRRRHKTLRKTL